MKQYVISAVYKYTCIHSKEKKFLPVGNTMAIHTITGSFQKSFTDKVAWPIANDNIVSIPMRTVVSRCFMAFPKRWQICEIRDIRLKSWPD